jgi:acyl-coenzyme A synthetase/AMP-(fatty) acid ligase
MISRLQPFAPRTAVSTLLPVYMLPARWRELDALPKYVNGKIDRKELKSGFAREMAAPARPVVGS